MDIQTVLRSLKTYWPDLPKKDEDLVLRAYDFAVQAHKGQIRNNGEPVIQHPLNAAYLLTTVHADPISLAVALLHDVPEDTSVSIEDIEKEFGQEVAVLVSGMIKVSKVRYYGDDQQIENLRRLFLAMASDVRVLFVKLADRLHNMRTLDGVKPHKRSRIARETLEIYAPIADRLGIYQIKCELEDLSFKYIWPADYEDLDKKMSREYGHREKYMAAAKKALADILRKEKIDAEITGRVKHLYSIYKKMKSKGKDLEEIYDKFALRVIVKNIQVCYGALGAIHATWRPMPRRFKDYIAVPKVNGYQSLHTTVFPAPCSELKGQSIRPVEVQIRTLRMQEEAEFGAAVHWLYSERKQSVPLSSAQRAWIEDLARLQKSTASNPELAKELLNDIFQDRIYVLTPMGDVRDLPKGATPVDFAYGLHTDIGHSCKMAKINGKIKPLDYELQNGDQIEILTKSEATPNHYWLTFVKTNNARSKIKAWFKAQNKTARLNLGRKIVDRELERLNLGSFVKLSPIKKKSLLRELPYATTDEVLMAVGDGSLSPDYLLRKIFSRNDLLVKRKRQRIIPRLSRFGKAKLDKIVVAGVGDVLIHLKECCDPQPGDQIIGYITNNNGVSVHRKDCPVVKSITHKERLISVSWEKEQQDVYHAYIKLQAHDRSNLLRDITALLSSLNIGLHGVSSHHQEGKGDVDINLTLNLSDVGLLNNVMKKLEEIEEVYQVQRVKQW